MRNFTNFAAQGDVMFRRMDALPEGVKLVQPAGDRVVVTHSETGHDHVMVLDRVADPLPSVQMYSTDNPLIAWIKVNRPSSLTHLRDHDTHEPIAFKEGVYEVRRQREYTPEGFRQVAD